MAQPTRGTFITFEGGDGSGKSTQTAELARRLRQAGRTVCLTAEPGGTALGDAVRRFLEEQAAASRAPLSPEAELFLFAAARAQHVAELIRPALDRGETVISDRFADSSVAYQAYGRGLPVEQVNTANALATGGLTPNLTVLLDVDPEQGLQRAASAAKQDDAIGKAPLAFHRRVRKGFLALASQEPNRFLVLDATQPKPDVAAEVWKRIQALPNPVILSETTPFTDKP